MASDTPQPTPEGVSPLLTANARADLCNDLASGEPVARLAAIAVINAYAEQVDALLAERAEMRLLVAQMLDLVDSAQHAPVGSVGGWLTLLRERVDALLARTKETTP